MVKLPLGHTVMTRGVAALVDNFGVVFALQLNALLLRHAAGDWGEVDTEDKKTNDAAVKHGYRILSAYTVAGVKLWIITEADRSVTTILLPEEY